MKTKEEMASIAAEARFDLLGRITYGEIYEQGFIAGYTAAGKEAREKAVKALDTILAEVIVTALLGKPLKLGIDYRKKFLKLYDNE